MTSSWKPGGWHSVTPRLVTTEPAKLVAFLKATFGATGDLPANAPAILHIGDSKVMVSGTSARSVKPAFLYVYVEDADETFRRALAAGATVVEAPCDVPYGDRRAMVTDPFGNDWQIATFRGAPAAVPDA